MQLKMLFKNEQIHTQVLHQCGITFYSIFNIYILLQQQEISTFHTNLGVVVCSFDKDQCAIYRLSFRILEK